MSNHSAAKSRDAHDFRVAVGAWMPRLAPIIALSAFTVAAWLLHRELAEYRLSDVRNALRATPGSRIAIAAALTVLNYCVLVVYEGLAVKAAGRELPLAKVALASFLGFTTSFNFGALLGGASIRTRLYSTWGLGATTILKIIALLAAAFWSGIALIAAVAFLSSPSAEGGATLAGMPLRYLGIALAAAVAAYFVLTAVRRTPLRIGAVQFTLPRWPIAVAQAAVSSLDVAIAASVLWVLLPQELAIGYPTLLAGYVLAILATTFSQVPGGLGVFEIVVLSYISVANAPGVIGAALLYRLVYYVVPLLVATVVYVGHELRTHDERLREVGAGVARWAGPVVPRLLALLAFGSGVVLLLSGATPPLPDRVAVLKQIVPLAVLESGHLMGSIAGTLLLVLSSGLAKRFDSAWWTAVVLVAAGIVASLAKGLDWEEACYLAVVLGLLLATRRRFYRRGSLLHAPLSASWWTAVLIAVAAAIWLGMFAHKHVEYSDDLWWKVALQADAPRFLRAGLASVVTVLVFATLLFVRSSRPEMQRPSNEELDEAARVIASQPGTVGHLALAGDKSLLWNNPRTAFVMYGVHGRTWAALGDPVGPGDEAPELAWRFHEMVDRHGGRTAFYQVPAASLPLYLQLGLTPLKLGDAARVPLATFSYDGPQRKQLRQTWHRFEREGFEFEVVPSAAVPSVLPRLREISDEWLAAKHATEKQYSVGFFAEDYLRRFPAAVVRKGGVIYAFANVLETNAKTELSIDLMRHASDMPNGTMDYLFGQLMQWGRDQGYQQFSLGMAPLSGLDRHPLAPIWNRAGNALFTHGEHFYNFEGLRSYKEKFAPIWEPMYLLYPGGMSLPQVLLDLAALSAGSVTGIVAKPRRRGHSR
ncbi:MAG: bifunctional lysylphosphatidylglycerol flippase/synthetase MprF [Planctomycetales bacterium]|nr:bifunctional lysylphosphatidylglycerol flippase/synthetase MprF [Planctomycetales bacterium]